MPRMAPPVSTGMETANRVRAVAPHDDNDLTISPCRALWVGSAGDVEVIAADDTVARVFTAVSAGTLLPVSCSRVLATNTTASDILALYN